MGDEPLPDPRLRPIAPPEPEHVAPPRLAAMKAMGGVGTLGLEVVLSILFGLFGGQWLDGRFGTTPWLTLIGSGFGLAAAVRAVLRQTRRMKIEAAREEAAEGNPTPLWESDEEKRRRAVEAKREADAAAEGGEPEERR
jgi:ATP synthase protein I